MERVMIGRACSRSVRQQGRGRSAAATWSGASHGAKWPTPFSGKTSTSSPTSPIPSSWIGKQRLVLQPPDDADRDLQAWARRARPRPGMAASSSDRGHDDLARPVPVEHGGQRAGPAPLVDVDLPLFRRRSSAGRHAWQSSCRRRLQSPSPRSRLPCRGCGRRAYIGRRRAGPHPRSGSSGRSAGAAN